MKRLEESATEFQQDSSSAKLDSEESRALSGGHPVSHFGKKETMSSPL